MKNAKEAVSRKWWHVEYRSCLLVLEVFSQADVIRKLQEWHELSAIELSTKQHYEWLPYSTSIPYEETLFRSKLSTAYLSTRRSKLGEKSDMRRAQAVINLIYPCWAAYVMDWPSISATEESIPANGCNSLQSLFYGRCGPHPFKARNQGYRNVYVSTRG